MPYNNQYGGYNGRGGYGGGNYGGGGRGGASGYGNYRYGQGGSGYGGGRPAYNGPYRNGNGGGGYNRGNQGTNNGQQRKTSGCKRKQGYTVKATGEHVDAPVISGWIKRYGEFVSFVGVPNRDPDTKREDRKKFVLKVKPGMGEPYTTTGFWDTTKNVLRIPDLNLYADPNRDFVYKISGRRR